MPLVPPHYIIHREVFVSLQISDIHLCHYRNDNVSGALHHFCSETLDTIRPSVVMATGDLTHGKYSDDRTSKQFQIEWDWYHKVLTQCQVREKVVWLDIRGNHGNGNGRGVMCFY